MYVSLCLNPLILDNSSVYICSCSDVSPYKITSVKRTVTNHYSCIYRIVHYHIHIGIYSSCTWGCCNVRKLKSREISLVHNLLVSYLAQSKEVMILSCSVYWNGCFGGKIFCEVWGLRWVLRGYPILQQLQMIEPQMNETKIGDCVLAKISKMIITRKIMKTTETINSCQSNSPHFDLLFDLLV